MCIRDRTSLYSAVKTLDSMYQGGIYDHIAGGFARYSVDEKWLVPHFEKMLYDNASLAYLYLNAFRITKNEKYKKTVEKTLDYLSKEMISNEGGVYAAQDADSEGVEGKFFVWDKKEIEKILNKDEADKIRKDAQHQIQVEKDRAITDIKKEVVDLSISVAEKLINKNISEQDNSSLIEESLKKIKKYEA